jgi:hypothetical protein
MNPQTSFRHACFAALGSLVSCACLGQTVERRQDGPVIVTRVSSTFAQTTPAGSVIHESPCAKNPISNCAHSVAVDKSFTAIPIKGGTNSTQIDVQARMSATEVSEKSMQSQKALSAGGATGGH